MKPRSLLGQTVFACALLAFIAARAETIRVVESFSPGDFQLVSEKHAATVCVDKNDFTVVQIAATNFVADVASVSGIKPQLVAVPKDAENVIFIGLVIIPAS